MSVTGIIVIALLVSACAFGINQVMLMSQDIKYIKSHIKDRIDVDHKKQDETNNNS